MSSDLDKKLINNIKNNVDLDESLDILYDLYSSVYYKIIHFHFSSDQESDQRKELIKECKYHVFFAAKEFKFDKKIKFSSYLGNKARWMCLNFFNRRKNQEKKLKEKYDIEPNFTDQGVVSIINKEILTKIKSEIKKEKDFRVDKIFSMRYFDCPTHKLASWREISGKMNMSIQGCINIHNRFINKIKSKKIL